MKPFLFLLAASVMIFSCSRNEAVLQPSGVPAIEFKIDAVQKQYVQINAAASVVSQGRKSYSIVATKDPVTQNSFTIVIYTDSLRPGIYSVPSTTGNFISFHEAGNVAVSLNQYFAVNIVSNQSGLINGSFSGTLYNSTTGGNSSIVQGKITDVQFEYH